MPQAFENILVFAVLLGLSSVLMAQSFYNVYVSENLPAVTSVSSETFTEHMQYLKDNFNVIPLDELILVVRPTANR